MQAVKPLLTADSMDSDRFWRTHWCRAHTNTHTHLPIEARCHSDDVTSLVVNGKHVGRGALGILGQDLVTQHPIGCFWVVLIHGCHRHHKWSWKGDTQQVNAHIHMCVWEGRWDFYEHICQLYGVFVCAGVGGTLRKSDILWVFLCAISKMTL